MVAISMPPTWLTRKKPECHGLARDQGCPLWSISSWDFPAWDRNVSLVDRYRPRDPVYLFRVELSKGCIRISGSRHFNLKRGEGCRLEGFGFPPSSPQEDQADAPHHGFRGEQVKTWAEQRGDRAWKAVPQAV